MDQNRIDTSINDNDNINRAINDDKHIDVNSDPNNNNQSNNNPNNNNPNNNNVNNSNQNDSNDSPNNDSPNNDGKDNDRKDSPNLLQQIGCEEWSHCTDESIGLGLESFPREYRLGVWQQVPASRRAPVLLAMPSITRQYFIRHLDSSEVAGMLAEFDASELLEISDDLPDSLLHSTLQQLDEKQRKHYITANQYDPNHIGHYIDGQVITVPINASVHNAQRILNRPLPAWTDTVFLTDRTGRLSASVPVNSIMTAPSHRVIAELVDPDAERLTGETDILDAISQLSQQNRSALPVVDKEGFLLGRVTLQDALKLQKEHYENIQRASGGLSREEDLFAPLYKSIKGRTFWLGINLLTALMASWTIGLFEHTLTQVVALAVLMPVVASMGGIAGSQTLTLIIRAVALDQISESNIKALIRKEVRVGFANGLIWSLLIGVIGYIWFGNADIGLVIGLAILVNLIVAAIAGFFVPVLLDKIKIDPALSGAVILTTVTDIVGFFVFLGLGTIILL